MRRINEIIVHCTATEQGKEYHAADINRWHNQRGFAGIGYHFVVCLDGTIEAGRPISKPGAHCKSHNAESIGIAYVGGIKGFNAADTRTEAQKAALVGLIRTLLHCYPSINRITSHHDYNPLKACPSFDATLEYRNLLK